MTDVVIIGGGPGGYEAALVASQLGGQVTLIERSGLGGSAVLTDVVPSKTLIATAEVMTTMRGAHDLGLRLGSSEDPAQALQVDLAAVNDRVLRLATAQSTDIHTRLEAEGVRVINGTGRLDGTEYVLALPGDPPARTRDQAAGDPATPAAQQRNELPPTSSWWPPAPPHVNSPPPSRTANGSSPGRSCTTCANCRSG